MGTITAQTLIDRAAVLLNDIDYTRWTNSEMLGWLTDGEREAVVMLPRLYTKLVVRTTVLGARQSLSDLTDYNILLGVVRNMAADGVTPDRAITLVSENLLIALDPYWQTNTPDTTAVHYTYDPSIRDKYNLYPPMVAGEKVEVLYSAVPPALAALTDVIVLPDEAATALVDYAVYRALSKDAEHADMAQLALAHYKLFTDAVAKL